MEILDRKSTKRCTERDGQRPTFPITTITSADKKKKKEKKKIESQRYGKFIRVERIVSKALLEKSGRWKVLKSSILTVVLCSLRNLN